MINSGLVEERTGIVVYLFYEVGFNVGVTFFFFCLTCLLGWCIKKTMQSFQEVNGGFSWWREEVLRRNPKELLPVQL